MPRKDFVVQVITQETHEFTVNANTPEEACSVAEQYFQEGERNELTGETEIVDTIAVESELES